MPSIHQLVLRLRTRSHFIAKQSVLHAKWLAKQETVWVDYGWMRLPYHGDGDKQEVYYHLNGKHYWDTERKLLSNYVKPGDVAIDVGANLGFLTGLVSGMVGAAGRVHSFEPSPAIYAKLNAVIQANQYKNVSAYNVGCGESEAKMTLHCTAASGNSTLNSGRDAELEIRSTQEVRIVRLDDFLAEKLKRLDLLKIDTEGFEDCVLAGAIGLLQKFKPTVYLELTSEYLNSSQRAVKILKESGYRFVQEPVLEECHNGENFIALHESTNGR